MKVWKKLRNMKGFTFVEILAVLTLLSVLVAVAVPIVAKYVGKGKDDYNEELKNQLVLAGKAYYASNPKLLPVKRSVYVDKVATSYVLAITLETNNFLSKELVDADGRRCLNSYVFVRQDENTTKNNYHSCLICADEKGNVKNYSKDDAYCKITDFTVTEPSTCGKISITDYQRKTNGDVYYNPKNIILGADESELSLIIIKNKSLKETDKNYETKIDLSKGNIDLSNTNLVNYMPKSNGNVITGKYSITILNKGGQETTCINNIAFDNEKPTCEFVYNNDNLSIKASDNFTVDESLNTRIETVKQTFTIDNMKNKYQDPIEDVKNGIYYGYVMDEAGNIGTCQKEITNKTKEDPTPTPEPDSSKDTDTDPMPTPEPDPSPVPTPVPVPTPDPTPYVPTGSPPYCYFSQNSPTGWLKAGSSTTLQVTCKSQGSSTKVSTGNVSTTNSLGTLSTPSKSSNYVYNITYTPKNSKTGTDSVKIGAGFIKDSYGSSSAITSNNLKIDTIPPVASISFGSSDKGGFYAKGVHITLTCTDKGSGIKNSKLNSKSSDASTPNKVTIINTAVGKSLSYTGTCWDNAGNSTSVSKTINVKEYSADKECGCSKSVTCKTYNTCQTANCGCSVRNSCQTSACGCKTYSSCSSCGCSSYSSWSSSSKDYCSSKCYGGGTGTINYAPSCSASSGTYKIITCQKYLKTCKSGVAGGQGTNYHCVKKTTKTRSCKSYKSCSSCSCKTYKSCQNASCTCKTYKSCANSACGCKTYNNCPSYKSCYHY